MQIVLIEDSDTDAEMVTRSLRKAQYRGEIIRFRDGDEALQFILLDAGVVSSAKQARLILLDINLPGMDGIEVLRLLRADREAGTLPIVMLTASSDERDRIDSHNLGVNMFLVKPVQDDVLADMLRYTEAYWNP